MNQTIPVQNLDQNNQPLPQAPQNIPAAEPVANYEKPPKEDRAGSHRSIYEVSKWEVFWRNFIAGMARSLGGIVIYLLFLLFMASILSQVVYPRIKPFLDQYQQAL